MCSFHTWQGGRCLTPGQSVCVSALLTCILWTLNKLLGITEAWGAGPFASFQDEVSYRVRSTSSNRHAWLMRFSLV